MKVQNIRGKVSRLLITWGGVIIMTISTSAFAQNADGQESVDEILVTGSHIKRSGFETVSNLEVIGQEDLLASGYRTVSDVIRYVTAQTGSNVMHDQGSSDGTRGEAAINLRGLGVGATLILVNGRRYTKTPNLDQEGIRAVDINSIPFNMIERIEILKAGASAIYGSDGVAGVVNFVTRKELDGVEAGVNYQEVASGGSYDTAAYLSAGISGDNGYASAYFNYFERTGMEARDATFTAENLYFSTTVHPASFRVIGPGDGMGGFADVVTDLGTFPGAPDGGPRIADPDCLNLPGQGDVHLLADDSSFGGVSRCLGDILGLMTLTLPETRSQFAVEGEYELSDKISFFGEAGFSTTDVTELLPGQLGLVQFGSPATVPASHPANVFGVDLKYVGASINPYMDPSLCPGTVCGTRATINHVNDTLRAVGGLEFEINNAWSADVSFNWSKSSTDANWNGLNVDTAALQLALDGMGGFSGNELFNPFASAYLDPDLANSPELLDWLLLSKHDIRIVDLKVYEANLIGEIGAIGGRPIGIAIGAQRREEELTFDIDSHTNQNLEFPGTPGIPDAFGTQDVSAMYAEVSLPILDNLELQAALRYEDYGSGIGDTTDPKIAARFDATDWLSFRAGYGTSFRGPDITNTSVDTFGSPGGRDPVRLIGGEFVCTRTSPSDPFVDDRLDDMFTATRGGTNLSPEESESVDFGIVLRPKDNLRISADYWSIDYTDIMSRGDSGPTIVLNDCFDDGIPNDPRISRDPATGRVTIIETSWINAASVESSGVDLAASLDWDTGIGHFTSGLQATYVDTFDIQLESGGQVFDGAGNINQLNPYRPTPEWRTNVRVGWSRNAHAANAIIRHIGSYTNDNPAGNDTSTIDSMVTVDLQYVFTAQVLASNTRLSIGLLNAFDEEVPVVESQFLRYDPRTHDPRGRMYYANLTLSF